MAAGVRTKQEALQAVATWLGGMCEASGVEDVIDIDAATPAEVRRVEWAMEEAQRRVYRWGER